MRFFVLMLGILIPCLGQARILELTDFRDVEPLVDEVVQRHRPQEVLLVLDYDHTIAQTLGVGGESWFRWQLSELERPPQGRSKLISSLLDILYLQVFILEHVPAELVQPEKTQILSRFQRGGIRSIVVTARNPIFRDITLKDLERFGIEFESSGLQPAEGFGRNYFPYRNEHPESDGLEPDAVSRYGLFSTPRPIRYEKGILFTSGQHKGAMLRTLLHKTGAAPTAIIFVDDALHHLQSVEQAFAGSAIEMHSIHYTRSPADAVQWDKPMLRKWRKDFRQMLPKLKQRMSQRDCFQWLGDVTQSSETAY